MPPLPFPSLTPNQRAAIESMRKTNGQLLCWPEGLTHEELQDLEYQGIIYHRFGSPATYAHTSYHLTEEFS